MNFRIADTFTDSLSRLAGDEQKAVNSQDHNPNTGNSPARGIRTGSQRIRSATQGGARSQLLLGPALVSAQLASRANASRVCSIRLCADNSVV